MTPKTAALLVALTTLLAGCTSAPATPAPPSATTVRVATPVVADIPVTATFPAHIEAVERVEIRPRVAGQLEAVLFKEGAYVRRGELLARVDARPYRAALADAEAALREAAAQAELAHRESDRAARLLERGAAAVEEAERLRAAAEVADARVAAARAEVEKSRLDVGFAEVRAPISGRIGRAEVTSGNLVDASTRIAVLVSGDPVYVRFDVDEATLVANDPGRASAWEVTFRSMDGTASGRGSVAFLDNEIGAGTGTVRVRAALPNPDGRWIPGAYGSAEVTFRTRRGALLVDAAAIGNDQGRPFVLLADDENKVEYRPVVTGPERDGRRVVEEGLSADDRVILDGLMRVRPGAAVDPAALTASRKEN
ncbi:MAG TPA: efflux RND transporter periplasmic adaptor subunit [Candidatus Polarisedimenticolaceae bacterium]